MELFRIFKINLSPLIVPLLTFKEFIQHAFEIFRWVFDVLTGIFSILNHRPVCIQIKSHLNLQREGELLVWRVYMNKARYGELAQNVWRKICRRVRGLLRQLALKIRATHCRELPTGIAGDEAPQIENWIPWTCLLSWLWKRCLNQLQNHLDPE